MEYGEAEGIFLQAFDTAFQSFLNDVPQERAELLRFPQPLGLENPLKCLVDFRSV